jgi:hypothetical protein
VGRQLKKHQGKQPIWLQVGNTEVIVADRPATWEFICQATAAAGQQPTLDNPASQHPSVLASKSSDQFGCRAFH